ncbi:LysR family transcriptional regulator [Cognatishimia activa]|uniref:HTH-type transcriptional regulator GltC n=1 Tax=Cognatishimia activa TaxID=1715691 RepID=A0A0N7MBR9_9RHOB|nr:LysR family transcriptional regulator [Cognatishimia activa]CUJ01374.1 HTH-type transcriptional regulator GltC [Cognatishimia activa]CUK26176.1 HTH-type transcriptional regulator GltC [Cognatishimia activa]
MDLKFLESFLLVAEHNSIAAAARAQNLTAAAVSQRLTALEAELGVKLVIREGQKMAITADGAAIQPTVRHMLHLRHDMERLLASKQLSGTLRVGSISTALSVFGADLVERMQREAAKVSLQLQPGSSEELYEAFEARDIDMAVVVAPPFELPKSVRFYEIATQEIGLVRRKDKPQDQPFVVYDRNSWGGRTCWEALRQYNHSPRVICEMDAPEVIAQMVIDGLGQAVLPKWPGLRLDDANLHFESLGVSRSIGLLCWQSQVDAPLTELILKLMQFR